MSCGGGTLVVYSDLAEASEGENREETWTLQRLLTADIGCRAGYSGKNILYF